MTEVSGFQRWLISVGSRMTAPHVILTMFRPGSRSLKLLQVPRCKLTKKRLSVIGSPFSDSIGRSVPRVAPKFLVPELGALFLVSKSGKVRVEERERDRGESSRLLVSAANVSTLLFLDRMVLAVNGFHDLERSTANHVLERSADLCNVLQLLNIH